MNYTKRLILRRIKTYINVSTLRYLLRHPRSLKDSFSIISSHTLIVTEAARCFTISPQMIHKFLTELYNSHPNLKEIIGKVSSTEGRLKVIGLEWVYLAVRALKPSIVLETGVSAGCSSAVILLALDRNKNGHLHSIDITDFLSNRKEVGWVIPQNLRVRWSLHIGKSTEVMQTLLPKLGQIDIFFHDSDHSYSNMISEFMMAYPYIRPGGLLLADDINRNRAFSDFCALVGVDRASKNKYFGVLRKPKYERDIYE